MIHKDKISLFGVYLGCLFFIGFSIWIIYVNGIMDLFSIITAFLFSITAFLIILKKLLGYQFGQVLIAIEACYLASSGFLNPLFSESERLHAGEQLMPLPYRVMLVLVFEIILLFIFYSFQKQSKKLKKFVDGQAPPSISLGTKIVRVFLIIIGYCVYILLAIFVIMLINYLFFR